MNKLLSANFSRLIKNKAFLVSMACMLVFGVFISVKSYMNQIQYGTSFLVDNIFFGYAAVIPILCAAFCSLFTGTEYSDGTIRNKIIAGHSRASVYLANLLTCSAACLLMGLIYMAAVGAVGIPLLGAFHVDLKIVAVFVLDSFAMILSLSAVFVLLSMLNQNKAAVVAVSLIAVILLFVAASYVQNRLSAPEVYDGYVFTDSAGNSQTQSIPNPEYLRGNSRTIHEFLMDFLPTGQAIQIANMSAPRLWQMPMYSLIIVAGTTAGGLLAFRKKDLK